VVVDELPVTSSGKIDRRALAALETSRVEDRAAEPPRDGVERKIAAIFQRLLKEGDVGRDADFFLLGGDSLSLLELQTRLRDAFGVPLVSIHEDPTVAAIAVQVRAAQAASSGGRLAMPVLFALREQGSAPPLYLVHGRLGQALVTPHFLQLLGDDQPVWAFQARGLDGIEAPHAAIEAMAADYVDEVRKRQPEGPYFIGALCAGALIAMSMGRLLSRMGKTVLPLLLLDPPDRPFAMASASMTEERLLARLTKKQLKGRVDAPLDDPLFAKASIRVARAMERAVRTHRPQPYHGPVYMLSSGGRLEESTPATELYAGKVTRYEVARTHSEILDTHNELFATQLARCLKEIREAQPSAAVN
jgi:acyl carrier protein